MRPFRIVQSITSRESHSLEKYLQEISREPLVPIDEEEALVERIRKGENEARQRLIKGNLRFVVSVAKKYQGHGIPLADLVNEGNLGLIKAAGKFDPSRGFRFITFAVWWIRQSILNAIMLHAGVIRLPMNKVLLKSRLMQAQVILEQELERIASPEELAEMLGLDLAEINSSFAYQQKAVSLDAQMGEEEECTLLDVLENPDAEPSDRSVYYTESLQREIRMSLKSLPLRQQEMLCYFYGIGTDNAMSIEDIGAKYDLSQERVRQIRDKAIEKLRANPNFSRLRSFL